MRPSLCERSSSTPLNMTASTPGHSLHRAACQMLRRLGWSPADLGWSPGKSGGRPNLSHLLRLGPAQGRERGVCSFKGLARRERGGSSAAASLLAIQDPRVRLLPPTGSAPQPGALEPSRSRLGTFAPGPSLVWTPWRCPVCDAMGLRLPILLLLLCCVSGLPFYNGFYYSNRPNGRNLGNGYSEGIFNGVKLVVETPEETLFSHRGANVTLPCRYHYEPALASPRPVRIKWWKLSENGVPEQDVLVAIGLRQRTFGDYRGRVRLRQDRAREVSLEIRDLRLEDYGRYRCEVIDGLEDESGLVELELRGVVFPYQHPQGRYKFNFHEAQQACEEQDAVVASFEQLFRAWEEGLDWCNAGWLQDASVQYPVTQARRPCGGLGLAPGVRSYGPRHRRLHRYDVFCFAVALRGQVYYLEHPEKLTLAEAREACREDGAQIAKVGQLFAAWKFRGLDRCDAGWLADGSARYPVAHPRSNCGALEPGVRSFGFPDPHSRQYGVYCYRPR